MSGDFEILGYDPDFGIIDYFEWDPATETFRVSSVQDVEGILESNKRAYASVDERARWGDGQLVAEIPLVVLHELQKMGIGDLEDQANDYKRLRKTLDDPVFSKFRRRPGKLSR